MVFNVDVAVNVIVGTVLMWLSVSVLAVDIVCDVFVGVEVDVVLGVGCRC